MKGQKTNLVALGINNGWFDGTLQYKAYIDFALNVSFIYRLRSVSDFLLEHLQATHLTVSVQLLPQHLQLAMRSSFEAVFFHWQQQRLFFSSKYLLQRY